jgi:3-deoxy-D-manno-octulosonic-acid transferase
MARERAGRIAVPPAFAAGHPRLWLHGASVGEISALPPILAELERRLPGAQAMVSALTDTGLDTARRLFGAERGFALPLDLPAPLARAFEALRPSALVVAETEFWPGLIAAARERDVPVLIVNGRLSPASLGRYRLLAPLFRPAARALAGVAAQSAADRERFLALGVSAPVAVLGSSKFDGVAWEPPPAPPAWVGGRPVVVAGSTRAGDEAFIADALARLKAIAPEVDPLLLLAPRHLPRGPLVERELARRGLALVRRSAEPGPLAGAVTAAAERGAAVLLLDTHGELAEAYRIGVVAIVGGGFLGVGGHNLLEPASRGRAVAFGARQRAVAGEDELLVAAGGGFRCADPLALAEVLAPLVRDPAAAAEAGRRARAALAGARGAAGRIAEFVAARLAAEGER